ncbi:MAG: alkaline shock response membrane anchor protein AmaP [Peptococcaceae bacterium]|nr:alkaline shock response membrane anchor protein AmaP [Peptococcaceae bacterium]
MFRTIFGVFLIALGGWIFLLATGWKIPYEYTVQLVEWLRANPLQSIFSSLGLILVGFLLVRNQPFSFNKPFLFKFKKGELRINQTALKDIVARSTSGFDGLRKSSSLVKTKEDGIEVSVFCQFADGYDSSLVSEKIREKVSQDIEQYSGIKVKEVKVLFSPHHLGFAAKKK